VSSGSLPHAADKMLMSATGVEKDTDKAVTSQSALQAAMN